MTTAEFKAWFGGFAEAIHGLPTEAQWRRIVDRVSEIDGEPVTERVFIDRYWPMYWPPVPTYVYPRWTPGWSYCGVVGGDPGNPVVEFDEDRVASRHRLARLG